MDRKPAEKGQGARKAIAAVQPAPEDDAAKPAAASKGRGRRQEPSSDCPGKAKTSLVNQGKGSGHSGKESAPRGRKTSLENSTPGAEKCDRPAGKSDNPPGDEGALQKRERHLQAKAFEPEKADVASGAVSREKNRLPDGEKKEAPHRGKKASQKARPPPAKEPPEQGRAEAVPRGPPPPQGISLRQVLERLTLRRVEISDASQRVNSVRDLLVEAIRKRLYLSSNSVQIVGTGSYYEHLKITKPDEFDIMLKVPGVRVELEPYNGGDCKGVYYFVKLKRNPGLQRLNDFVDDQQYLSASKFLSELRSIIINEVKTIN
ncbi:PREDICTED: cyclic GMP-AMP synthase-like, partial [Gekko japonicus]|uniref:Cyclic GMP-AMP synthase-like n=1 Tax=Gekko japonicus TaxID=146911 RepID=A0ABM1JMM6_GEKJA